MLSRSIIIGTLLSFCHLLCACSSPKHSLAELAGSERRQSDPCVSHIITRTDTVCFIGSARYDAKRQLIAGLADSHRFVVKKPFDARRLVLCPSSYGDISSDSSTDTLTATEFVRRFTNARIDWVRAVHLSSDASDFRFRTPGAVLDPERRVIVGATQAGKSVEIPFEQVQYATLGSAPNDIGWIIAIAGLAVVIGVIVWAASFHFTGVFNPNGQ